MPRYNVVTVRALYNAVLIDALSVDEAETDTWAERLHDVREVDESDEEAILP